MCVFLATVMVVLQCINFRRKDAINYCVSNAYMHAHTGVDGYIYVIALGVFVLVLLLVLVTIMTLFMCFCGYTRRLRVHSKQQGNILIH